MPAQLMEPCGPPLMVGKNGSTCSRIRKTFRLLPIQLPVAEALAVVLAAVVAVLVAVEPAVGVAAVEPANAQVAAAVLMDLQAEPQETDRIVLKAPIDLAAQAEKVVAMLKVTVMLNQKARTDHALTEPTLWLDCWNA